MKTKLTLSLTFGLLLAGVCGNLFSQSAPATITTPANGGNETTVSDPAKNPDIIVITGKIIDAETKQPIKNTKINFDKFGEEVLQASLDDKGNYLLTLNKKSLGNPVRIVFKIAGYKRYIVKSLDRKATQMTANIFLEPVESDEKSNADVKYSMSDSPFNTMVIKMQ